jgi:hypothetical protein
VPVQRYDRCTSPTVDSEVGRPNVSRLCDCLRAELGQLVAPLTAEERDTRAPVSAADRGTST